jgi:hypothetical protein
MGEDQHSLGSVPVWSITVNDVRHHTQGDECVIRRPGVAKEKKEKEQEENENTEAMFVCHAMSSLRDFTTEPLQSGLETYSRISPSTSD